MADEERLKAAGRLLHIEQQARINRGIRIGEDVTFGLGFRLPNWGSTVITGKVVEAKDGWITLDNDITVNLNSPDVIFFGRGSAAIDMIENAMDV